MTHNEPHYSLEQMDACDWRFEESRAMADASDLFYDILEEYAGTRKFSTKLRAFLKQCPFHINALRYYGACKFEEGKTIDAYAFFQTAVSIGKKAFPENFDSKEDCLPSGWVENRPFLNALHGLMLTQEKLFDRRGAIETAYELIEFDPEDRLGARLCLPTYLLRENRNAEALSVFEIPRFKDAFYTESYLHALALLRLHRDEEAKNILKSCLKYHPQVARYLIEPHTPHPINDGQFGIVSGSPYEGWYYATEYALLWQNTLDALGILRTLAKPIADAGWPNRFEK